jgi:molybdate transport system substrate-binding protein
MHDARDAWADCYADQPFRHLPVNPAYPDHPANRRPSAQALAGGKVLTVFSVAALEVALKQASQRFEQTTDWQVALCFNTSPELMAKLRDGWRADIWIAPAPVLVHAAALGMVGTHQPLAQVGVGVAVAQGQVAPDISTLEAWQSAVRRALAVFYTHASSGQYIHGLLSSMDILDEVRTKVHRFDNGEAMLIALSQAGASQGAMAMGAISEIHTFAQRGVAFVGPLPPVIAHQTIYALAMDLQSPRLGQAQRWVHLCQQAQVWGDVSRTGIEPL